MSYPASETGVRFEWLRANPGETADWTPAIGQNGLVWLLNFGGEMDLAWTHAGRRVLKPGAMACLRPASGHGLAAARPLPGQQHECLALFFSDPWLAENVQQLRQELPADYRVVLLGPHPAIPMVTRPLDPSDKSWAQGLLAPHWCEAARSLLTRARMTEFLLQKVFTPAPQRELFCTRTKWLAMERIEKVKAALLESLDEPPPLDALAVLAGVNAHHLSRTFSQVEGITLTAWIRRERIDRAAKLIASGRCNVSEAAVEVGYQSLSHFSRAFLEEKGVTPSRWVEHLQRG